MTRVVNANKGEQMRVLLRKLTAQTANLMGNGGGGFDALTTGDIQGLLMSCDATPLTWAFFEAKHEIADRTRFERLLIPWTLNRLMKSSKINLKYIAKNHTTNVQAAHELSEGLSKYLARHKIKADNLSPYFEIEKSKFSRYYAPFIRELVADLEADLGRLERQIIERLEK